MLRLLYRKKISSCIRGLLLLCLAGSALSGVQAATAPSLSRDVAPGVVYQRYTLLQPVAAVCHVVVLEASRPELLLDLVYAQTLPHPGCYSIGTLVTQDGLPGRCLAALNAGYFSHYCFPVGTLARNGELLHEMSKAWVHVGVLPGNRLVLGNQLDFDVELGLPDGSRLDVQLNGRATLSRVALWTSFYQPYAARRPVSWWGVLPGGAPRIGQDCRASVATVGPATFTDTIVAGDAVLAAHGKQAQQLAALLREGAEVTVHTPSLPEPWPQAHCIVMGAGWLVDEGQPQPDRWGHFGDAFSGLQPRSAIGADATQVYLVAVDGRQPGYSMGLTLAGLAEFMAHTLGCDRAANLDGGGSTSLWVDGEVVNCPSEDAHLPCEGEPRGIHNALAVFQQ